MAGQANQQRTQWVDAAKGVGILLVIAGHVWWQPGPVHQFIYSFHMPLFFLLSGYMVRPQPTGTLLVRQRRSLLVPFAIFSLLLLAADFTIEGMRGVRPLFGDWAAGIKGIVLHPEALRGPFTILWFVPCLFFARMVWNILANCIPDATDWRWLALIVAIMTLAHWIAARTTASPLGLMAVPAALTMLWVGQLWRARPPGPLLLALPGDLGVPFLSLAGAAAVSIILCKALARLPDMLMGPLAWLGRVSLVIMYVHVAFIHYLSAQYSKPVLFGIALAGSLVIHLAAAATRPGRMLLLGERS